ncbi:MAG: hypothetical protein QM753_14035 [Thermomicrobiales bacterium]
MPIRRRVVPIIGPIIASLVLLLTPFGGSIASAADATPTVEATVTPTEGASSRTTTLGGLLSSDDDDATPAATGPIAATADNPTVPTTPAEQQLVDKYLPVVYVRQQESTCAAPPEGGEAYRPLPVDLVLGNNAVQLKDGANNDEVIAEGVNAQQLATYGPDTYLDFPGNPRDPGCEYMTDERAWTAEHNLQNTTYARVVYDAANHRLALQYWFFWYFNEWNNLHEADWEMIQIMWEDVSGVDDALAKTPVATGFSQHSAGELGLWTDSKLEFEDGPGGTHLRIYSGAGSHASFYAPRTFLQWGENSSGFGCDTTFAPSVRVPVVAQIVAEPIDPNGPYAWILYPGRWGERAPSVFNGVHGPGYNSRWLDPWRKLDRWNSSNIVVPEPGTLGVTATQAFCSISRTGSQLLIQAKLHPWAVTPLLAVVVAVFVYAYRRARLIFRRAIAYYRRFWRLFMGIGLMALPIGVFFNVIQALVINVGPLRYMQNWMGDDAGARLSGVIAVGSVQQLAMLAIIGPAIVQAVADLHHGKTVTIRSAYAGALRRWKPIVVAGAIAVVLAGVPALTLIGLPVAIWLAIRWQFFGQVLIFDRDCNGPDALTRSARLVKGHWWRALFGSLLFDLMATIPGVVIGFGLLTVGRTAVGFANGVSSLLYVVLMPLSVIALTILFMDWRNDPLTIEPGTAPEPATGNELAAASPA